MPWRLGSVRKACDSGTLSGASQIATSVKLFEFRYKVDGSIRDLGQHLAGSSISCSRFSGVRQRVVRAQQGSISLGDLKTHGDVKWPALESACYLGADLIVI